MTDTLTAEQLDAALRAQGMPAGIGNARSMLRHWRATGVVEEVLPGRYRLTPRGRELTRGLLNIARDEAAA